MIYMVDNKRNLKLFYKVGAKSFLTGGSTIGDQETFYMNALRFYIPVINRITFDKHGVGVGIFNMQGFERRNKESKNTLQRFSITKGNIVIHNLKRLWDVFYNEKNAY